MTIQQASRQLVTRLSHLYEKREAGNIAELVMENITGWKRINRLLNKQHVLPAAQINLLEQYTTQLLQHRPVQYVLGEAWFYGMKLHVDEHVLIPRPETEELVDWAVHDIVSGERRNDKISLFDVGTGSGCIAMALKKELPLACVYACDVSKEALQVAGKNALLNDLQISFLECDFLQQEQWNRLPDVDVLISNPPYIPLADQAAMHLNVLQYEPRLALFVHDDDPLIFYKAIARFVQTRLCSTGSVYMEIHEGMAASVTEMFRIYGFENAICKQDLQGKDRMLKLVKNG